MKTIGKRNRQRQDEFCSEAYLCNGKKQWEKSDIDEALQLVPPDPTELLEVVEGLSERS